MEAAIKNVSIGKKRDNKKKDIRSNSLINPRTFEILVLEITLALATLAMNYTRKTEPLAFSSTNLNLVIAMVICIN